MHRKPSLDEISLSDGLVLQAFMLQVCLELSRVHRDPHSWQRTFIDELVLHLKGSGIVDPVRDAALARIEKLDRELSRLLVDESRSIRD